MKHSGIKNNQKYLLPEYNIEYYHPGHEGWLIGYVVGIDVNDWEKCKTGDFCHGVPITVQPSTDSTDYLGMNWTIASNPFMEYWIKT